MDSKTRIAGPRISGVGIIASIARVSPGSHLRGIEEAVGANVRDLAPAPED
jgi:hypothetical protein